MSDPLVRIEDEAGHAYQVFKSKFHELYEDLGYKITFLIGESEGPNEIAPPASETSTEHIAPPPVVDAVTAPVADAAPVVDAGAVEEKPGDRPLESAAQEAVEPSPVPPAPMSQDPAVSADSHAV